MLPSIKSPTLKFRKKKHSELLSAFTIFFIFKSYFDRYQWSRPSLQKVITVHDINLLESPVFPLPETLHMTIHRRTLGWQSRLHILVQMAGLRSLKYTASKSIVAGCTGGEGRQSGVQMKLFKLKKIAIKKIYLRKQNFTFQRNRTTTHLHKVTESSSHNQFLIDQRTTKWKPQCREIRWVWH